MFNILHKIKEKAKPKAIHKHDLPSNEVILNNLRIIQLPPSEVPKFCGAGRACYNRRLNRIVIQEITTENDHEIFRDLGEEVWHAMGGEHKHR